MNHSLLLAERLQYRHRPRVWRYVSDSEPPTPPSLDYFDHELRPTRRPRKIASTKSRRTDTLKLMYTMPLDVLFEVNPAVAISKVLERLTLETDIWPSSSFGCT